MDDRPVAHHPDVHVLEFDADDTLSLHRPDAERVLVLNASAREIWRLLREPHRPSELRQRLAERYAVDPDSIRADVDSTLRTFWAEGLLASEACR